jgi:hypothetical protein
MRKKKYGRLSDRKIKTSALSLKKFTVFEKSKTKLLTQFASCNVSPERVKSSKIKSISKKLIIKKMVKDLRNGYEVDDADVKKLTAATY